MAINVEEYFNAWFQKSFKKSIELVKCNLNLKMYSKKVQHLSGGSGCSASFRVVTILRRVRKRGIPLVCVTFFYRIIPTSGDGAGAGGGAVLECGTIGG